MSAPDQLTEPARFYQYAASRGETRGPVEARCHFVGLLDQVPDTEGGQ